MFASWAPSSRPYRQGELSDCLLETQLWGFTLSSLLPPDTHRTKDPEDVGRGPDSVLGLALTDRAYAAGKTGVERVHR